MAVYLIESDDSNNGFDPYEGFTPIDDSEFVTIHDVKKLNRTPIPITRTDDGDEVFSFRNHQFSLDDFVTAMYDEVPAYIIGVMDEDSPYSFPLYLEHLRPNLSDEEISDRKIRKYLNISYPESDDYGYVNLYRALDTTHTQSIKDFRDEYDHSYGWMDL